MSIIKKVPLAGDTIYEETLSREEKTTFTIAQLDSQISDYEASIISHKEQIAALKKKKADALALGD